MEAEVVYKLFAGYQTKFDSTKLDSTVGTDMDDHRVAHGALSTKLNRESVQLIHAAAVAL